jgi:hypothetical protein
MLGNTSVRPVFVTAILLDCFEMAREVIDACPEL